MHRGSISLFEAAQSNDIDDIEIATPQSSSVDIEREEMLWTDKLEELLLRFINTCDSSSIKHLQKARKYKQMFLCISISILICTLLLNFVSPFTTEENLINKIGMLIAGFLTGINTIIDPSSKSQKHYEYAFRYEDQARQMKYYYTIPKRFRPAADMFLTRCRERLGRLGSSAPDV